MFVPSVADPVWRCDDFAAQREFSKQARDAEGSRTMRRLVQVTVLATAASTPVFAGSIVMGAPFVSADAFLYQEQHEPTHKELSRAQLQAISAWLSWNREGWFGAKRIESGDAVQIR